MLMVLFIPLRYRVNAYFGEDNRKTGRQGDYSISVKAKWLLGIVSAEFIYPDEGGGIKLFFIPVRKRKKTGRRKKSRKSKVKEKNLNKHEVKSETVSESQTVPESQNKPVSRIKRKHVKNKKAKKDRKKNKGFQRNKIKSYYGILSSSENRGAYSFIKKTLIRLIKHSAPGEVRADMIIGLEEPCNTGLLFGALGIVISFIKGKYNITPDFYNKRVDGRVYIKGKIRSVIVIYHLIRIFTNSDIKKVTGQFKAVR